MSDQEYISFLGNPKGFNEEFEKETLKTIEIAGENHILHLMNVIRSQPYCENPQCNNCIWNATAWKHCCERLLELAVESLKSLKAGGN